jgi:hypothetical protein
MTTEALLALQLLTRQMESLQVRLNDAIVKGQFDAAIEYANQITADARMIVEKISEGMK